MNEDQLREMIESVVGEDDAKLMEILSGCARFGAALAALFSGMITAGMDEQHALFLCASYIRATMTGKPNES